MRGSICRNALFHPIFQATRKRGDAQMEGPSHRGGWFDAHTTTMLPGPCPRSRRTFNPTAGAGGLSREGRCCRSPEPATAQWGGSSSSKPSAEMTQPATSPPSCYCGAGTSSTTVGEFSTVQLECGLCGKAAPASFHQHRFAAKPSKIFRSKFAFVIKCFSSYFPIVFVSRLLITCTFL